MSVKYFYSILILFVVSSLFTLQAQDIKSLMSNGDKLFADNFYRNALPFYEQVLATEPNNSKALLRIRSKCR